MEIACTHCNTQFNIPDEKIPKGRKASMLCPKCKQRIHIVTGEEGAHNVEAPPVPTQRQEHDTPVYNAADRPFGILDQNARTALLCITYPHANDMALKVMNSMQYHIMNVDDVQTALKSMTYHLFNIVILDEDFDINRRGCRHIMEYLNELDMMSRRKIVVLLISKNMHTMDNMAAFHASVNQIINYKQVNSMESLLQRTIIEHDQFYTVYNETLKKLGKMA